MINVIKQNKRFRKPTLVIQIFKYFMQLIVQNKVIKHITLNYATFKTIGNFKGTKYIFKFSMDKQTALFNNKLIGNIRKTFSKILLTTYQALFVRRKNSRKIHFFS